jgi:hypothetical protein
MENGTKNAVAAKDMSIGKGGGNVRYLTTSQ